MVKINSVGQGRVTINQDKYHQALIIGDEAIERNASRLKEQYGTTHKIGPWEKVVLFSSNPEVILIATGWQGALEVGEKFKAQAQKRSIEFKEVLTGKFKKAYHDLVKSGKRVNALIHTTC